MDSSVSEQKSSHLLSERALTATAHWRYAGRSFVKINELFVR